MTAAVRPGGPATTASRPGPLALTGVLLLLLMAWFSWGSVRQGIWVDLDVYRAGGEVVLRGGSLYDVSVEDLPFTYPPFAAVLFAPLALLPVAVGRVVVTVLTLGLTAVVVEVVRRRVGLGLAALLPVALACVVLEPLFRTVLLGQVNALLVALVVVDCLVVPPRYRGLLLGVAAGIKLTPAVFVVWLLLRGERGAVARMAGGFAVTVAVGALALPDASRFFWSGGFGDLGRFGDAAVLGTDNQSGSAALARLAGLTHVPSWLVLAVGVLAVGAGALVARRRLAVGDEVGALLAVAVGGLLASPVSWSHHWMWLLPALVWMRRHIPWPWLAGTVGVAWIGPFWFVHRWPPQALPYPVGARLLALAYPLLGAVLLVLLARQERSRTPVDDA